MPTPEDRSDTEIEVAPEMIEAGAEEFLSFDSRFEVEDDCVVRVYEAMERMRLELIEREKRAKDGG